MSERRKFDLHDIKWLYEKGAFDEDNKNKKKYLYKKNPVEKKIDIPSMPVKAEATKPYLDINLGNYDIVAGNFKNQTYASFNKTSLNEYEALFKDKAITKENIDEIVKSVFGFTPTYDMLQQYIKNFDTSNIFKGITNKHVIGHGFESPFIANIKNKKYKFGKNSSFVALDLETTGKIGSKQYITEIGIASLVNGQYGSQNILVGFDKSTASNIEDLITKYELGQKLTNDEIVTLDRIIKYAPSQGATYAMLNSANGIASVTNISDISLTDFSTRAEAASVAREGLGIFTGKNNVKELAQYNSVISSENGYNEYLSRVKGMLQSNISNANTYVLTNNGTLFDVPILKSHFGEDIIDATKHVDMLELMRLGTNYSIDKLNYILKQTTGLNNINLTNMKLEDIAEALKGIGIIDNTASHRADFDALTTLKFAMLGQQNNMLEVLTKNAAHFYNNDLFADINLLASAKKGKTSTFYNMNGIRLTENDIFLSQFNGEYFYDNYQTFLNSKTSYRLVGITQGNALLGEAAETMAEHNKFFSLVLMDTNNNVIMLNRRKLDDLQSMLKNFVPIKSKRSEKKFLQEQQYNLIDKARRRLDGIIDPLDSRNPYALKQMYDISKYHEIVYNELIKSGHKYNNMSDLNFNKMYELFSSGSLSDEAAAAYNNMLSLLSIDGGKYNVSLARDYIAVADIINKERKILEPHVNKILQAFGINGDKDSIENIKKAKIALNELYSKYFGNNRFVYSEVKSPVKKAIAKLDLSKVNGITYDGIIRDLIKESNDGAIDLANSLLKIDITRPEIAANKVSSIIRKAFEKENSFDNFDIAQFEEKFDKYRNDFVNKLIRNSGYDLPKYITHSDSDAYYKLVDFFNYMIKNNLYTVEQDKYKVVRDLSEPILNSNDPSIVNNIIKKAKNIYSDIDYGIKNEQDRILDFASKLKKTGLSALGDDTVEELAGFLSKVDVNLRSYGASLSYKIIKAGEGVEERFVLQMAALKTAEDVSKGKVLGKVAEIELGNKINYKGIDVILKSGYRQIDSRFVYFDKNGNTKIKSGMAHAISKANNVARLVSDSLLNDDADMASKITNKQINRVLSKMVRFENNIYEGEAPKLSDYVNAQKIYTTDFMEALVALDLEKDNSGVSKLQKLKSYTKETFMEYLQQEISNLTYESTKKAREVIQKKNMLDVSDIQAVIKNMLNTEIELDYDKYGRVISARAKQDANPITRELAKVMEATGMNVDEMAHFVFTGHEVELGKNMSMFLVNPYEYSAFGFATKASRPIVRQRLNTFLFKQDEVKDIISKALLTTKKEQESLLKTGDYIGTFKGKMLLMSQKELDDIIEGLVIEHNIDKSSKLYKELRAINITNQESIMNSKFGQLHQKLKREYTFNDLAILDKEIEESISKDGFAKVKKGQIIANVHKEGIQQKQFADFDGVLRKIADGRYVLEKDAAYQGTLKSYIAGSEKSVSKILSDEAYKLLSSKTGEFDVLGNFELEKHAANDVLLQDYYYKKIEELVAQGISEEEAMHVVTDEINMTYGKGFASVKNGQIVLNGHYSGTPKVLKTSSSVNSKYGYYLVNMNIGSPETEAIDFKGGKINPRFLESMYRMTDEDGRVIGRRFIQELISDNNVSGRYLKTVRKLSKDYKSYIGFLRHYSDLQQINDAKEIDLMSVPFFKKRIEYEDLTEKYANKKLFATSGDFVKIKLEKQVDNFGAGNNRKSITELILPNTHIFGAQGEDFLTSDYQKSVVELARRTAEIRSYKAGRKGLSDFGYKTEEEMYSAYDKAVLNIMSSTQSTVKNKDGMLEVLSSRRLKRSDILLNKELFKPNDVFTAGSSGAEDVIYISRQKAIEMFGVSKEEYLKNYAGLLEKEEVVKRLKSTAGEITNEAIEKEWGTFGLAARYPTIMHGSAKAVKVRVVEDGVIANNNIMMFSHTSKTMNADVDSDHILLALLDPNKYSNNKKLIKSFEERYKHQENVNKAYRLYLEENYSKHFGFDGKNLSLNEMVEKLKEKDENVASIFSSTRNLEGFKEAIQGGYAKQAIGKSNIPSLMLRQAANIASEHKVMTQDAKLMLEAFTEVAEQKMIDSIKTIGSQDDIATLYHRAVVNSIKNNNKDNVVKNISAFFSKFDNEKYYEETALRYVLNKGNEEMVKKFINDADFKAQTISQVKNSLPSLMIETISHSAKHIKNNIGIPITEDMSDDMLEQIIKGKMFKVHSNNANVLLARSTGIKTKSLQRQYKSFEKAHIKIQDTTEESFKQTARDTISMAKEAAQKTIKSSSLMKSAGIGIASALIAAAIVKPNPVGTRAMDDVGLVDDDENIDTVYATAQPTNPVRAVAPQKAGYQINIYADTDYSSISPEYMQQLMSASFGGELNVRMQMYNNRSGILPHRIEDLLASSIH